MKKLLANSPSVVPFSAKYYLLENDNNIVDSSNNSLVDDPIYLDGFDVSIFKENSINLIFSKFAHSLDSAKVSFHPSFFDFGYSEKRSFSPKERYNEKRDFSFRDGNDNIPYSDEFGMNNYEEYLPIPKTETQEEFELKLINLIKNQYFEYGFESQADLFFEQELKKDLLTAKSNLNSVFIKYFSNAPILIGILQIVSRLPESTIFPEGMTIALASIPNKNIEVRECAIRCFENWVSQNSIDILENIHTEPEWLQEYIDSVLTSIKEVVCPS